MSEMSMSEEAIKAAFEAGNKALDSAYEVINEDTPTDKRTRDARKLKWWERQYGAGFVAGFWLGVVAGFPLAAGVAAVCKVFVTWLFTFS